MYGPEIDSYLDQFLTYLKLEKGFSSHSISSYRTDLPQFIQFLEDKLLLFLEIEIDSTNQHIKHMNQRNLSAKSIARKISSLRQFYLFL